MLKNLNDNNVYYIAETAFHHEGNLDFLKSLIYSFDSVNVSAVKFHLLFDLADYMVSDHPAIEALQKIILPKSVWPEIFEIIAKLNKEIILLCNDLESLKWANSVQGKFPISGIELHSTGLNDIFLLEEILNFNKTIILGIGGSSFEEIQYAVDFLRGRGKNDVLLMHGFQNYPTKPSDLNLRRIELLKAAFDLPVGYADHTDPFNVNNAFISTLPILLGVNVIEKHLTNDFGSKRIDSQSAVSIDVMANIIKLGDELFEALGTTSFQLSQSELDYGNTGPMKKAIVARKNIKIGEVIRLADVAFKRTESQSPLKQLDLSKLIGSEAISEISKDEILNFSNVRYDFKRSDFNQFFINTK